MRTYGTVKIGKSCNIGKYSLINDGTKLYDETRIGKYCSIGKIVKLER